MRTGISHLAAVVMLGFLVTQLTAQGPEKSGGASKKEAAPKDGKAPIVGGAEKADDDAITPAIARVQEIDDRLARFAKSLEDAAELNRRMNDLKSEGKTREAIRRALIEYESIVDEFKKVKRDVKIIAPLLKDSLGKASPEFIRAAEEYQGKAVAEKFPAHQEKYREMATEARKHAEGYKKDHVDFDGKVKLVFDLIEFVEANGRLASDMRKHLGLHRDAGKAQYLDRLIAVIGIQQKQFDEMYQIWRDHLDQRRGAIQDGQPVQPGQPPFPGAPSILPSKSSNSDSKSGKSIADKSAIPARKSPASSSVRVSLPAGARLWVDGVEYVSASPVLTFETPKLPTTHPQYFYTMKMELVRGGRVATSTQRVVITPGQPVEVDFNAAAELRTASR